MTKDSGEMMTYREFEEELGRLVEAGIFERLPDGRMQLTKLGKQVARLLEAQMPIKGVWVEEES